MDFIKLEHEDSIATITIDRQDKLNALNAELLGELDAALTELVRDTTIACAILTGAGEKAFAAGADIAAMLEMSTEQARAFAAIGHGIATRFEQCTAIMVTC